MTNVVDLSLVLDEETSTYPGDPDQQFTSVATVEEDGYALTELTLSSHFGTHLDAPSHVIADGRTLDEYPPERFVGKAVCLDVREMDPIEPTLPDLDSGTIVFFWTGRGAESMGSTNDRPTLSAATARELADCNCSIVGFDLPSPDTDPYPIHDILLGNDVLIAENVANLGRVAGQRFRCSILPLKVRNADGSPCRAIAELETGGKS
jgi:kynurenine formamidase